MANELSLKWLRVVCAVIGGLVGLWACGQRTPSAYPGQVYALSIDTNHPAQLYRSLTNNAPPIIDSLYLELCMALCREGKINLAQEHSDYHVQLRKINPHKDGLSYLIAGCRAVQQAQYDTSDNNFKNALRLFTEQGNIRGQAFAHALWAVNYGMTGHYDQSIGHNYQALKLFEQCSDSTQIYFTKRDLSDDLCNHQDYDQAFSLLQQCMAYYTARADSLNIEISRMYIGKYYYSRRQLDKAYDYTFSAISYLEKQGSPINVATAYNHAGLILLRQRKLDSAISYFRKTLAIIQQWGNKGDIITLKQNLAYCIWEYNKGKEAETTIFEGIEEALKINQRKSLVNSYSMLAKINMEKGRFDSAFHYFKAFKAWSDSVYSDENAKVIAEYNIKYQAEEAEQRIEGLTLQKKAERIELMQYFLFYLLLLFVVLTCLGFLFYSYKKSKRQIAEGQKELNKNKEDLRSFMDNLGEANQFIVDLEAKIEEIQMRTEAKEKFKVDEWGELQHFKILTEDNWTQFKLKVDKVHPGLINRLRSRFPDLAQGEQRQFLLMKLHIDGKDAASMLGISVNSVRQNRYRLKKKFGLGEQDSLEEFVARFDLS